MERKCLHCDKSLTGKQKKYCSNKCMRKVLRARGSSQPMVIIVCQRCGKQKSVELSHRKARYCSHTCANKGRVAWDYWTPEAKQKYKKFLSERSRSWVKEKNPAWKGEEAPPAAKRIWIKRHLLSQICEKCNSKRTRLRNKSGVVTRNVEDWALVCQDCGTVATQLKIK